MISFLCAADNKNINKKQQPEAMPDPINALQNLASQGTRNPMPTQMMGIGDSVGPGNANPNANILQNLIHVTFAIYKIFTFAT